LDFLTDNGSGPQNGRVWKPGLWVGLLFPLNHLPLVENGSYLALDWFSPAGLLRGGGPAAWRRARLAPILSERFRVVRLWPWVPSLAGLPVANLAVKDQGVYTAPPCDRSKN